jgi:hypothetical protein
MKVSAIMQGFFRSIVCSTEFVVFSETFKFKTIY